MGKTELEYHSQQQPNQFNSLKIILCGYFSVIFFRRIHFMALYSLAEQLKSIWGALSLISS